jgi:hypothetical protein
MLLGFFLSHFRWPAPGRGTRGSRGRSPSPPFLCRRGAGRPETLPKIETADGASGLQVFYKYLRAGGQGRTPVARRPLSLFWQFWTLPLGQGILHCL